MFYKKNSYFWLELHFIANFLLKSTWVFFGHMFAALYLCILRRTASRFKNQLHVVRDWPSVRVNSRVIDVSATARKFRKFKYYGTTSTTPTTLTRILKLGISQVCDDIEICALSLKAHFMRVFWVCAFFSNYK